MKFYINENTHEIHKSTCKYAKDSKKYPHVIYLGSYKSSEEAVKAAIKKGYSKANGGHYCNPKTDTD